MTKPAGRARGIHNRRREITVRSGSIQKTFPAERLRMSLLSVNDYGDRGRRQREQADDMASGDQFGAAVQTLPQRPVREPAASAV
jgi:hypothetical protein